MTEVPQMLRAGRSPLVGRGLLLAQLAEHLREAQAGRSAVVLVAGAPGIGKTRLLEEFPPPNLAQDIIVLRGGGSQAQGMPPYLPFLEALGEYITVAPTEQLRQQLGVSARSLLPVFPEIGARLGTDLAHHALGYEQERFRLYEAVVAFLAAIAARGALALLLDDLQWADSATLDLLIHVASRLRSASLLIVGAYREGEAEENPAFLRALAELNRRRLLVTLTLSPLDVEESQVLATHLLRGEIASEVSRLLQQHGEGNPFFLEELLRALVTEGMLIRQDGRWELGSYPHRLLPPRVYEAIHVRLARLESGMMELLRIAAVVGRTCEPSLLAQVMQIDVERVETMLMAAARAQLMRPEADGTYAFTHDMVRETLYADVSSTRRKRLHLAIGEALEADGKEDTPQRLADLTFHFTEAEASERGAAYALTSGEQALRASAVVEALAHYRTALRLLGASGDLQQRAATLMGLGNVATLAGDYEQAVAAYNEAQESWLRSGDVARAAEAWQRLGRVYWRREAVGQAQAAFERALELLDTQNSEPAAETLLLLADLHVTTLHQHLVGIALMERALKMVESLGNLRLEATAYCVSGNIRARCGDLSGGQILLERALKLAQQLDDPVLEAEACAYLANVYAAAGAPNRSREVTVLRLEFARRTQDLFQLRHVYSWLGSLAMLQGRWTEAEQALTQQEEILEGVPSPEPAASLKMYRGLLYYLRGRFAEAEKEYHDAIALVRGTGSGTVLWYLGRYGLILAELDRHAEALDCFMKLDALASALDERANARRFAYTHLAVGYARLGGRRHKALDERAAACYALLLPFQHQHTPIMVDRALGLAALAGGDPITARRHLLDAEAVAREADLLPELALTLIQRGLIERDLNQVRTKHNAITQGLRLCAELGMEELGRRTLKPPEPGQHSGGRERIVGLSPREREILRLIAQGQTNREIAQTLILSEKTVARHLTHIYTKIGVDNRAGAAAYALRHGLA